MTKKTIEPFNCGYCGHYVSDADLKSGKCHAKQDAHFDTYVYVTAKLPCHAETVDIPALAASIRKTIADHDAQDGDA